MTQFVSYILLLVAPVVMVSGQREFDGAIGDHAGTMTTGSHPVDEFPPDFSDGEVQSDGSVCITKVRVVEKMEKQSIKECWHQNVSACHDTYVTEFKAMQEKKCDDNIYWKTCKISFKEIALNYTVRTCYNPLVRECRYRLPTDQKPKEVCRTWFETVCNTTYVKKEGEEVHDLGHKHIKAATWCEKVPKKICAPDHCNMVPGPEECHDKTIVSTIVKPEEICDLQPTTECQVVTNLIPHLITRPICEDVPKEFCHAKLDSPKLVKKPITMKWCTFPDGRTPRPQPSGFNIELLQGEATADLPTILNGKRSANNSTINNSDKIE